MKSTPLNKKELWLLLAPIGVLAVAGTLWTARERQRNEQASGPLRTVITKVQVLPVTPVEAWRGYTHRVTLEGRIDGTVPQVSGIKSNKIWSVDHSVALLDSTSAPLAPEVTRIGGGPDFINRCKTDVCSIAPPSRFRSDWDLSFLVKASQGYETWRFKGKVTSTEYFSLTDTKLAIPKVYRYVRVSNTYSRLEAVTAAAPFEVALDPAVIAQHEKRIPRVIDVNIADRSPVQRNRNSGELYDQLIVNLAEDSLLPATSQHKGKPFHSIQWLDYGLFDQRGKRVPSGGKQIAGDWNAPNMSTGAQKGALRAWLPLSRRLLIPEQVPITFKSYISINNSYPVRVEVPFHPIWYFRAPKTLQLLGVTTGKDEVKVRLRYTGQTPLEPRSELPILTEYLHRYRPRPNNPIAFSRVNKEAGKLLLFTTWSEYLERADGTEIWNRSPTSRVRTKGNIGVASISFRSHNAIEVTYKVEVSKLLREGETATFKAQIGVENDGFLPVEIKLARPRTKKGTVKRQLQIFPFFQRLNQSIESTKRSQGAVTSPR